MTTNVTTESTNEDETSEGAKTYTEFARKMTKDKRIRAAVGFAAAIGVALLARKYIATPVPEDETTED